LLRRLSRAFRITFTLLALTVGAALPAQELERGSTGRLSWEAPPGFAPLAKRLTSEAEVMLTDAHRWLGLSRGAGAVQTPQAGRLYWVRDRSELAARLGRASVPDWYAAVAQPLQGDVYLAVEVAGGESRLRSTLRHEIVHHAMGALPAEVFRRIPAWFHEGLAEAFSGEIYLGDVGVSLAWRANNGALSSLRRYAEGFPEDPIRAAEGYALGDAFVRRLIRVHGQPIIGEIIERLRLGDNLDQALLATTKKSLVENELALIEELRSLRSLLAASAPHVVTVLLFLAALLIPFALRRRARRRRAMEEKWQRQEDQASDEEDQRLADHAEALRAWMARERPAPDSRPEDDRS
jgi:hypothetical protein